MEKLCEKTCTLLLGNGRRAAALLALTSVVLLATVYFFQYVLRILPCELCYWQRKPHMLIIVLGILGALLSKPRPRAVLLALIALASFANMGISIFHVGVEYRWWEGLSSCSTPTAVTSTLEEARNLIFNSTVIPCDKPGWVFLGVSMAGWNGLASLAMGVFALLGMRRSLKG